jgi:hypothetical protein
VLDRVLLALFDAFGISDFAITAATTLSRECSFGGGGAPYMPDLEDNI